MKKKVIEPSELRVYLDAALKSGLVHTQKEFAELVGISETSISQFLKGTASISNQTIKRVKDAIEAKCIHIEGNANATATGPNSSAQVVSGDVGALIAELTEQRKAFVDQLKVKDEQISQLTGMLREVISGKK